MTDTLIFVYLVFFEILFASTFAFMWRMTGSLLEDVKKPRKPQRTVHPEMEDVKTGDELLIFSIDEDDD